MLALGLDELLAYTDEERAKWEDWFARHPDGLALPLQPGSRFETVGAVIDHVFLVEARHLARLRGEPVPDASGVAGGHPAALFAYGQQVRRALRAYVDGLADAEATTVREFTIQTTLYRLTPRKLLLHIGLHETRHWAQVALGVRQAGLAPPGEHDLLFSRALE